MTTESRSARATRWLDEQIEQLKALRNAKTRDTDFKQWRQATLTIVQRIWPGDAKRSARFRRVPFSPPSTRADGRETREHYERGCAEAIQLLASFMEDVERDGVGDESAVSRPASLDPGVAEDDFPTVDLPGGPPQPVKESPPAEPRAAESRPLRSAVPTAKPAEPARKKRRRNGSRRRLRDMLGLDALQKLGSGHEEIVDVELDVTASAVVAGDAGGQREDPVQTLPADAVDAEEAASARASGGIAPEHDTPRHGPARGDDEYGAAAAAAAPIAAAAADADIDFELDSTDIDETHFESDVSDPDTDGPATGTDPEAGADRAPRVTADDFLSASPVFKASGRPVQRLSREPRASEESPARSAGPRGLTTPTAIAVASVAAEVARLGVPERQRADVRGTLVALAETLEDGALDWSALRRAVEFSMEFPAIARRLIPLLIPFLDEAA